LPKDISPLTAGPAEDTGVPRAAVDGKHPAKDPAEDTGVPQAAVDGEHPAKDPAAGPAEDTKAPWAAVDGKHPAKDPAAGPAKDPAKFRQAAAAEMGAHSRAKAAFSNPAG